MKIIFYKALLKQRRGLTPNERILYSFLISKTLTRLEMVFNDDGTLDFSLVSEYCENGYFPMCEISHSKIAKELHITRRTIVGLMKDLESKRYIIDKDGAEYLYISNKIPQGGFFELEKIGELKGELLIFYSYLLNKSKRYNYTLDTYIYKLAEEYGVNDNTIKMLLRKLFRSGYVIRGTDKKLSIGV